MDSFLNKKAEEGKKTPTNDSTKTSTPTTPKKDDKDAPKSTDPKSLIRGFY